MKKLSRVVLSMLLAAHVMLLGGCESMDPNSKALLGSLLCAGIVAKADDSSDRGRNAVAAGLACYIGIKLALNAQERAAAASETQKLLYQDASQNHESTLSFAESGKSVTSRVGAGQMQEMDVSSAGTRSDEAEVATVMCRPTTMESRDAAGAVIGTYEANFCRVNGDWYPEQDARRMLSS